MDILNSLIVVFHNIYQNIKLYTLIQTLSNLSIIPQQRWGKKKLLKSKINAESHF